MTELAAQEGLLVTHQEAAQWLRVLVRTVHRLRRVGELRFIPGRPVRIPA